jgi:ankyrin repeat domain-containing protein 50
MSSLHRTLDSLPKTLDETYGRILNKINEDNQPIVQHILQCVCFCIRPLSVDEVRHICRIGSRRKPPFETEDALFHQKDVVDLCGGLLCLAVVHDWHADRLWSYLYDIETVQLTHFSVKEYLISIHAMSWRLDEELSHLYIIKAGIAYYLEFMASGDVTTPGVSMDDFHRDHSLAVYCPTYIQNHLSHLDPREHPDLTESFRYLLDPTPQSSFNHKLGLCYFYSWYDEDDVDEPEPLEVSTLRIAACLGLPMICQWLLSINTLIQIGSTVTEPGIESSFLTDAAFDGRADVLQVLLKAGADVNGKKWNYISPLYAAVCNGRREIAEILINWGADINIEHRGKTLVDLAIWHKHEDIAKILRSAGGRSSEQLKAWK